VFDLPPVELARRRRSGQEQCRCEALLRSRSIPTCSRLGGALSIETDRQANVDGDPDPKHVTTSYVAVLGSEWILLELPICAPRGLPWTAIATEMGGTARRAGTR